MILGIVGRRHDLFCDGPLWERKGSGVTKKKTKNVFFVKNDLKLADNKTFRKILFVFFLYLLSKTMVNPYQQKQTKLLVLRRIE
jgi:hypothetical protein